MRISSNLLKKHIEDSEEIDFLKVWDTFSIRTAEVESVIKKGEDLKDVVTAEILECEKHPEKDNYHILKVNDSKKVYNVLCGAPNVRVGLKTFFVKPGGMVSGFTVDVKKIGGVLSEGMACSGFELGINNDEDTIVELPENTKIGVEIHDVLPVRDIIVEIDNKSLTNRPDLWSHRGIAKEIAAITNTKLKPLDAPEIPNDKLDLDIEVKQKDLCKRYMGIKIDNVKNSKSPLDLQTTLFYTGIRPISLIVDLTNYVMVELGQPMHAFDSRKVSNIVVDLNKEEVFKTLDGKERKIDDSVLMIKNKTENIGLAGIMGGLDSEIEFDTTSIILESANFDASGVRKTSTKLGLRTDASVRFEKSMDPNMCSDAAKRFVKLLQEVDKDITIASNLTDIYPSPQEKNKVSLTKEKLFKYLGKEISDTVIKNILTSLDFSVSITENTINVEAPTNRSTKDITKDVDIIEEISRMYGYENIEEKPLILENTFKVHEEIFDLELDVKEFLTDKYKGREVHSYLWLDNQFLDENNLKVDNTKVINKKENNILRNDLTLSLLPIAKKNFKYFTSFTIYEIGSVIKSDTDKRSLSILLCDDVKCVEHLYKDAKEIVTNLFLKFKNKSITFKSGTKKDYSMDEYNRDIYVSDSLYGSINIISPKIMYNIAHKKSIVSIELDFDLFNTLKREDYFLKSVTDYQTILLDYTVSARKEALYKDLEVILEGFRDDLIIDYKLVGTFKGEKNNFTIRFEIGSFTKTLTQNEIQAFQEKFINHVKNSGMEVNEK